jgi:hypothetical protein
MRFYVASFKVDRVSGTRQFVAQFVRVVGRDSAKPPNKIACGCRLDSIARRV